MPRSPRRSFGPALRYLHAGRDAFNHLLTFGGNAVACAAALASLDSRRAAYTVLQQGPRGAPFEAALDRAWSRCPSPTGGWPTSSRPACCAARQRSTSGWRRWCPRLASGPPTPGVLRLGAFQLTALDRVPAHAAVDTSVSLAKETGGARAGGFVNAVLRRLAGRCRSAAPASRRGPSRRRADRGSRRRLASRTGWWSAGSRASARRRPSASAGTTPGRASCSSPRGRTAESWSGAGGRPASRSSPRRSAPGW